MNHPYPYYPPYPQSYYPYHLPPYDPQPFQKFPSQQSFYNHPQPLPSPFYHQPPPTTLNPPYPVHQNDSIQHHHSPPLSHANCLIKVQEGKTEKLVKEIEEGQFEGDYDVGYEGINEEKLLLVKEESRGCYQYDGITCPSTHSAVQASPTTGTFPLPQNHESSVLNSASSAAVGENSVDMTSSFMFQSHESPFNWPCISNLQNQTAMLSEIPVGDFTKNGATDSFADAKVLTNTTLNVTSAALQPRHTDTRVQSFSEPINGGDTGENLPLEGCQKEKYSLTGTVKTSEDGYNWRKYGKKHVKGSECPRSYYKCTNPNCPVKKKVERSLDGQITKIIYKGAHNHQIPHPSHLIGGSPGSFNNMLDIGEGIGSCVRVQGGEVWRNIQLGCKDINVGSDWWHEGQERSSSASVLTDISDPSSTAKGKSMGIFESVGTPEFSSTLGNGVGEDDDEDGTIQGKLSPGNEADDDKSESKRRKKGSLLTETSMMSRAMIMTCSVNSTAGDSFELHSHGGQSVGRFNIANDKFYSNRKSSQQLKSHSKKRTSHSVKFFDPGGATFD